MYRDGEMTYLCLVEICEPSNFSANGERFDSQLRHHNRDTVICTIIIFDETNGSPLNRFEFVNEHLSMGVPYCSAILQNGTDKSIISN